GPEERQEVTGSIRHAHGDLTDRRRIRHVHDEWVASRSLLGLEDPGHRGRREGIGAEAVYRLAGKCHETPRAHDPRGAGQGFRRRLENLGAPGHGVRPYLSGPAEDKVALDSPGGTP